MTSESGPVGVEQSDLKNGPAHNAPNAVWIFFGAVFLWSWGFWFPRLLQEIWGIEMGEALVFFTNIAALFGPSIFGVIFSAIYNQPKGTSRLFRKLWAPKFPWYWWLVVVGLPLVVAGGSYLLTTLVFQENVQDQGFFSSPLSVFTMFLTILGIGGPLAEEFGWRGFALDRLHAKWNPLVSSLVLGVIWSLWHLPLAFFPGTTQSAIPFWQFFLINTLLNLYYSWFYINTNGNLSVIIILHTVYNLSSWMFPYWTSGVGRYISFAVTIAILAGLLIWFDPKTFRLRKK
jgi:uncharacterized protein